MALEIILKTLGWIMVCVPLAIYLFVSINLILGASKDDGEIKGIVMLFMTCFGIGALILATTYLPDLILR
jgi:hypothetical protein